MGPRNIANSHLFSSFLATSSRVSEDNIGNESGSFKVLQPFKPTARSNNQRPLSAKKGAKGIRTEIGARDSSLAPLIVLN
jgi:hypothetical protein